MREFEVTVLEKKGKIAETFQKFTLAVVVYAINIESISHIKLVKLQKPCKYVMQKVKQLKICYMI